MDGWRPELELEEYDWGCRLSLRGVAYGEGETLQEAADDLVHRLAKVALCFRTSGFALARGFTAPDQHLTGFLWELGEMAERGEDIRERALGMAA
jgi:hypothetical protein